MTNMTTNKYILQQHPKNCNQLIRFKKLFIFLMSMTQLSKSPASNCPTHGS